MQAVLLMGRIHGTQSHCEACGRELRPDARFCRNCGEAIGAGEGAPPWATVPTGELVDGVDGDGATPSSSTRPRWLLAALLGLGAAAAVVAFVAVAGGSDRGPEAQGPPEVDEEAAPSEIDGGPDDADGGTEPILALDQGRVDAALDALPCSSPCALTGTIEFEHPTWGPSILVTLGLEELSGGDVSMHVIDGSGSTVWSREFGPNWYELAPAAPAIDDSGHLFIDFNPGRYNGVIILEPNDNGFEHFGTLSDDGDYNTRFYYAEVVDVDGDGTSEVEQSSNDCDPSCAGGSIETTVYRWDGTDYRAD